MTGHRVPRQAAATIETEPFPFVVEHVPPPPPPPPPPPTVRSVACRGAHRAPLTRDGGHLVVKNHHYVIGSGTQIDCRWSGVRLCELYPEDQNPRGRTMLRCDCPGEQ